MHEVITTPLISFNWTLVMIFVTLIILFLVLYKFFFKKVKNFLDEREKEVSDTYKDIESKEKIAEEEIKALEIKTNKLNEERREILLNAKKEAEQRAKDIINEAYEKSTNIIRNAEAVANTEKEKLIKEAKKEIAMLSILTAEKILNENLTTEQKKEYLEGIKFDG